MSYFPKRGGTYRPANERYPLMEALAVAVAVDRAQGFIKSQQGYYDDETETYVMDNRAAALQTLRIMNGIYDPFDEEGKERTCFRPNEEDQAVASEIYSHFDQILLFAKMGDELVQVGKDGLRNTFNEDMYRVFDSGEVDMNRDLAMIASLPNSRRVSAKRDEMDEFYATHKANGYIGDIKARIRISGLVKDVKYIPRHQIHLATLVTDEGKIVKFFMNDKLSDLAKRIDGTTISLVGTVKKHDVNDFTGCQETVINRVKFD